MEEKELNEMETKQGDMQESILENNCEYTEKVLCELYARLMRKRLLIIAIIWGIIDATFILLIFNGGFDPISAIGMAIITIVLAVQLIYLPKKQAKAACRRTKDLYNCYQQDKTVFYEDCIYATNLQSKAELEITYDKIAYILETKNEYCIYLKVKSIMLIDKHNFIKGTEQEFLNLMKSKNIQVK